MPETSREEERELNAAVEKVINSTSRKKLVVAGPGTGKTNLFKKILLASGSGPDRSLVLTFINNLVDELQKDLAGLATVSTLHAYCLGVLHRNRTLRSAFSPRFQCFPGLRTLIKHDWECFQGIVNVPKFIGEMRNLEENDHTNFYLSRSEYYDAVDFDDIVYRVHNGFRDGLASPERYDLVLIDEYQDFNRLEAGFIDLLAQNSPILIAGDDDQALYGKFRGSSWEHIRALWRDQEFEAFELPFCLRCPEVVVEAVNDILLMASKSSRLSGRIPKSYKYFEPAKGDDSRKYPRISVVKTSVQRLKANYMARYIAQTISDIPAEEKEEASQKRFPIALIIAEEPYRGQISAHLERVGLTSGSRAAPGQKLDRTSALSILKDNPDSNLGWRIILQADDPIFTGAAVRATSAGDVRLVDVLPKDFVRSVRADVDEYEEPSKVESEEADEPGVMVTSFQGAKGLSAQHVFVAGLHDGDLPRNPAAIQDLEICKILVGLTRTRKKCYLIHTNCFADKQWKTRSILIGWIANSRLDYTYVNKDYVRENGL